MAEEERLSRSHGADLASSNEVEMVLIPLSVPTFTHPNHANAINVTLVGTLTTRCLPCYEASS